jgi:hypothetical protein
MRKWTTRQEDDMTQGELKELLAKVVIAVPQAGNVLGLSRNASYEAARRGDIPTIRVGRLLKVPTAAFKAKFQIETEAA